MTIEPVTETKTVPLTKTTATEPLTEAANETAAPIDHMQSADADVTRVLSSYPEVCNAFDCSCIPGHYGGSFSLRCVLKF